VPFQLQLPHEAPSTAEIGQGEAFGQACLLRVAQAS
jgi:hypothetical protein